MLENPAWSREITLLFLSLTRLEKMPRARYITRIRHILVLRWGLQKPGRDLNKTQFIKKPYLTTFLYTRLESLSRRTVKGLCSVFLILMFLARMVFVTNWNKNEAKCSAWVIGSNIEESIFFVLIQRAPNRPCSKWYEWIGNFLMCYFLWTMSWISTCYLTNKTNTFLLSELLSSSGSALLKYTSSLKSPK